MKSEVSLAFMILAETRPGLLARPAFIKLYIVTERPKPDQPKTSHGTVLTFRKVGSGDQLYSAEKTGG